MRPNLHQRNRTTLTILYLAFVLALLVGGISPAMTQAQGGTSAATISNLNVRSGPGTNFNMIATIPAHVTVSIEGRNQVGNWVLINGGPSGVRGWVATRFLVWPDDVPLGSIPVVEGTGGVQVGTGIIGTGAVVEQANAWPASQMNLRQGPDTAFPSLGQLPAGTGLVLEGRTADNVWALVHTADGQSRGYVAAGFLSLQAGVTFEELPVVSEPVTPGAAAEAPPADTTLVAGVPSPGDTGGIFNMLLNDIPILPTITARTVQLYREGIAQGRNPNVFTKVGDSNSVRDQFMRLIGYGSYNLGPYSDLQSTIDRYMAPVGPNLANSFARESYAAQSGYTAWFVSDWRVSHPTCPGITPLECEYQHANPSVAVILYGLADLRFMTPQDYDFAMRRIIDTSIERSIVPVLFTFPAREDARPGEWEEHLQYNNILVALSWEYQIPLVNLWRATHHLPNHGVDDDQTHLSSTDGSFMDFTDAENRDGFTLWNLLTLQVLAAIQQAAG